MKLAMEATGPRSELSRESYLSHHPPAPGLNPARPQPRGTGRTPAGGPTLQTAGRPLTFNWRRLQPLADILHATVGVIEPGNCLSAPQLHEVPELHHGATKVPLMVAFGNRVPGVVVGHVVRHLAGAVAATPARGSCSAFPRRSGGGMLGAAPSLGAARVKRVPLTEPNFSG